MKIPQNLYDVMALKIEHISHKIPLHIEGVKKTGEFKSLERRILFDVFSVIRKDVECFFEGENVFKDFDDSHIETAMKKCFRANNIKIN